MLVEGVSAQHCYSLFVDIAMGDPGSGSDTVCGRLCGGVWELSEECVTIWSSVLSVGTCGLGLPSAPIPFGR